MDIMPAFEQTCEVGSRQLEALLEETDDKLAQAKPVFDKLAALRFRLFDRDPTHSGVIKGAQLDPSIDIISQLYDEPTYNIDFYRNELDYRQWGSINHTEAVAALDPSTEDSSDMIARKATYRTAIRQAAQQLGFIAHESRQATHPDDRALGIEDGELDPIAGNVDAIIIPGAAGLTNHKRLRDAIKNIESGTISTEHIIMTSCERPVSDREKQLATAADFHVGDTEFGSCLAAIDDLTTGFISGYVSFTQPVEFQNSTQNAQIISGIVEIGERQVGVDILSAPFDPERKLADGRPAERALTDETFVPALKLLPEGNGTIVIESHDVWAPAQTLTAQRVFGLRGDKKVIGTGPFNAGRLLGDADLSKASEVVSDMTKYIYELRQLRIAIATKIQQKTGKNL